MISKLTSSERLRRKGQVQVPVDALENLIVIGGSAGGHHAVIEILKDLPAELPAAIVILLHMQFGNLKDVLERST
ncbi:MAG TPA: chemotaxis protein CheB, partial [Syntrophobacteraceae bacterium]|nr:chemotaxis protein CheB [Syntrophobacteraceae bacterium]